MTVATDQETPERHYGNNEQGERESERLSIEVPFNYLISLFMFFKMHTFIMISDTTEVAWE